MAKTGIKMRGDDVHKKATPQQVKHDSADLQREIKGLKEKLEKNEWRIKELSSYLEALIRASSAESLEEAGLFKQLTGDCKKQALETCGLDT